MTRKFTRNASALRGIAPLIAVLTVMIALAPLAKIRGAGQRSAGSRVAELAGNPSRMVQGPLAPQQTDATAPPNTDPSRSQPLINTPLLFKLSGLYASGGQFALSVALADVNADGKLDLLTANSDGTVSVLLGNGDGTFKTAVSFNTGGFFARSLTVADVNRDGRPDLLLPMCSDVNCNGHSVGVLLGNGNGTFQQAVLYSSGGPDAGRVAVADTNGDGNPDIVMANSGTTVGVLLGNGDGTFHPAISYGSGGNGPGSIAVADLNGDGKPDLIVGNQCPLSLQCFHGVLGVLLGNGDGTFQTAVPYPSGGWGFNSVSVGDLNGDGKPDLAVSNNCVNGHGGCLHGIVGVLIGNGDGTFRAVQTYNSGSNFALDIAVADVNVDNKADLLVVHECSSCASGKLGVLLGNGDGTFQPAALYSSGGFQATSMAVGDVNADGRPDVLISNHCISSTDCGTGPVGVLLAVHVRTVTKVTTSGSPSRVNQPVTFTATVLSGFGPIPDGELVTFYDGAAAMGTGTTASGVATFTTSSLTAKTHTIKAIYPGDALFKPSTGLVTQVVNK